MDGGASFRERAVRLLQLAAEADEASDFEKALPLYENGVEALMLASRHEKSQRLRDIMLGKARDMMTRAEAIKDYLSDVRDATEKGAQKKSTAANEVDDKLAEALRSSITVERPTTTWDDIAGLSVAKQALKEAVELPLRAPQLFESGRLEPWRGILLYGPPGTGKTQLARAVANSAGGSDGGATFVTASAADLCGRYVGDSERLVKQLFVHAREQAPTVIFLDEIDSLVSARGGDGENEAMAKLKTEFLSQMDGVGDSGTSGVLVLAATNRPWTLDRAILRRFEKKIMIPLPDESARRAVLSIHLAAVPNTVDDASRAAIAAETEGWSGSELRSLVKEAGFLGLRTLQGATHFRRIPTTATASGEESSGFKFQITPCEPSHPEAEALTLNDVDQRGWMRQLHLPPLSAADLSAARTTIKGGAGKTGPDVEELKHFTMTHGSVG